MPHWKQRRLISYKYYCPVKDTSEKLRVNVTDACPLCGRRVNWRSAR